MSSIIETSVKYEIINCTIVTLILSRKEIKFKVETNALEHTIKEVLFQK